MQDTLKPDFAPAIARCLTDGAEPSPALVNIVRDMLDQPAPPDRASLEALQRRIETVPLANGKLALVYGGATKIKGYVFEAPKLPEIRGASALLDWVNEVELPGLWNAKSPGEYVERGIIYASGGNILAFAPAAQGPALAQAIERAYTEHTLIANSVAVSLPFTLLELRFGRNPTGYWIDDFLAAWKDDALQPALKEYYYLPEPTPAPVTASEIDPRHWRFFNRKTFGELVTVLASLANRRREERATAGEPRDVPRYGLIPWAAKCDSSDLRPAVFEGTVADELAPRQLSEPTARKRYIGQVVKLGPGRHEEKTGWFTERFGTWVPEGLAERSWEQEWLGFLQGHSELPYAQHADWYNAEPASDVGQIGAASIPRRYVGMIYADGDNVGRLIATLATPADYHRTSELLRDAARTAVFTALATHLAPVQARDTRDRERLVHPFEVLSIGGDDLMIIVPGSAALPIALTAAMTFEKLLVTGKERLSPPEGAVATDMAKSRYSAPTPVSAAAYTPAVGLSAGVIVSQENTPIFFLRDLVEELQKNAKRLAKKNGRKGFYGGAVDYMILKSVTMVSNDIASFRRAALGLGQGARSDLPMAWKGGSVFQSGERPKGPEERRLTAKPYTWHEFAGLLATVRALKAANMPRSQLYRLRRTLDASTSGIATSVVEYLYTRSRMRPTLSDVLVRQFEQPWHHQLSIAAASPPLPPWMLLPKDDKDSGGWETIWADLLEIYELIAPEVR